MKTVEEYFTHVRQLIRLRRLEARQRDALKRRASGPFFLAHQCLFRLQRFFQKSTQTFS